MQRAVQRREACRLDAEDLDVGLHVLRGDRDAGDQSAAPDRDDEGVEPRRGRQHLERYGALAGDDALVVVRVHDRQPVRACVVEPGEPRFVEGLADEDHFDAVLPRPLDLRVAA